MLTTALAFFAVISILIFVHELGHFLAARSVDIAAPRFSIGFGPRLAGFRWGETEFVLSAIPLGGYVKMAGMADDEAAEVLEGTDEEPVDPSRTFDSKPLWARAWVISAGVIMNVLFAVAAYFFVGAAYGEERLDTTRVTIDSTRIADAPPALAAVPVGARVVAFGERPVETWDDLLDAAIAAPAGPATLRFADAPPVEVDLPSDMRERARRLSVLQPLIEPVLEEVLSGRPAAEAGLRPGDRVVSVGGERVVDWYQVVDRIEASPDRPLVFEVERAGEILSFTVVPEGVREGGDTVGKVGAGVRDPYVYRSMDVGEAAGWAVSRTWGDAADIFTLLGQMISGEQSARNLGGLITIGEASGQAARLGLDRFLAFLALFSVNLAVLNLLPIPVLDGGHLMFLAVEAIRGRPLSAEARIRLSHVGLIVVVALILFANGNDILRKLGI